MGRDWKTLTAVVLGAAIVGWLTVRMVSRGPTTREPAAPAVVAARTEAAKPVAAPVAAPTMPPAAPRATAGAAGAGENGGGDADAIARDLEVLAQALVRDQRIEDRVLPRIDDALDVPGVTEYRRAPDFWEPALAGSGGSDR